MIKRRIGALLAAMIGLSLAASPAAALSWNANAFTGTVGVVEGPGIPETVCRYHSSGELNSITIKAPIVYGSHDQFTAVGWRYEVRLGVPFHRGDLVYRSRTWKTNASKTIPSDFAKKRFYLTQHGSDTTLYYLRVVLFWYAPASSTAVEGRGVVTYDHYNLKWGPQSRSGLNDACPFDYSYTQTG